MTRFESCLSLESENISTFRPSFDIERAVSKAEVPDPIIVTLFYIPY